MTHQNKIQASQVFFYHLSYHKNGQDWIIFLILNLLLLISYVQHEIFYLKVQLLQAQLLTRLYSFFFFLEKSFFNYFFKLPNKFILLNCCCYVILFMVAQEVVGIAAEMTVDQVQMLLVVIVMVVKKEIFRSWWWWWWLKWQIWWLWWWWGGGNCCYCYFCLCYYHFWRAKNRSYLQILDTRYFLQYFAENIFFFQHLFLEPKNQLRDFWEKSISSFQSL